MLVIMMMVMSMFVVVMMVVSMSMFVVMVMFMLLPGFEDFYLVTVLASASIAHDVTLYG
jgi:hypothetical protein